MNSYGLGNVNLARRFLMKRVIYVMVAISVIVGLMVMAGCGGEETSDDTDNQTTVDVTGAWSGDWHRSDGGEEGTLIANLTQSGDSLNGTMFFTSITFSYTQDTTISGDVEGNDVVFGMAVGGDGAEVTIDFEGTVAEDGNHMDGTYTMSTGYSGTWDVTRD